MPHLDPQATQSLPWTGSVSGVHSSPNKPSSTTFASRLVPRKAPRISLFAGSVLVLLSLFLPVSYNACGGNQSGAQFLTDAGIWPGAMTFVSPHFEWLVYVIALTFAVFTLGLWLAKGVRPALLQNKRVTKPALAISGALALFAIADLATVFLGYWSGTLVLEPIGLGDQAAMAIPLAITLIVSIMFIKSKLARRERWIFNLFAFYIALAGLQIADLIASFSSSWRLLDDQTTPALMASQSTLCWIIPIVLWYRMGLSKRPEENSRWPEIRKRIARLYIPLGIFDCICLAAVVSDGLYGFLAFFAGVQLLGLGYLELASRAPAPIERSTTIPVHSASSVALAH